MAPLGPGARAEAQVLAPPRRKPRSPAPSQAWPIASLHFPSFGDALRSLQGVENDPSDRMATRRRSGFFGSERQRSKSVARFQGHPQMKRMRSALTETARAFRERYPESTW